MEMIISIKLLPLLFLLAGCSSVPPYLIYASYGKIAFDAVSMINNAPSSNDILLSQLTGMNCRIINIFNDKDICIEKSATEKIKEYINDLKYNKELEK